MNLNQNHPSKKKWFFSSNWYKIDVMITSLREMLQLPNFPTSTIRFDYVIKTYWLYHWLTKCYCLIVFTSWDIFEIFYFTFLIIWIFSLKDQWFYMIPTSTIRFDYVIKTYWLYHWQKLWRHHLFSKYLYFKIWSSHFCWHHQNCNHVY